MLYSIGRRLLVCALAAPVAAASTYVVDDDGGPGVDFNSIGAAVAAAVPGDVVLVRPGWYAPFTVTIGISVRADGSPVTLGGPGPGAQIAGVPAGQRVVLSGFTVYDSIVATNCSGRVLIEHVRGVGAVTTARVLVDHCVDARIAASQDVHVVAIASRVEITNSTLRGRRGVDGCFPGDGCDPSAGSPGGTALEASAGADVHLGATTVRGGAGGDGGYFSFCPGFNGGSGGHAILANSSNVLVTGTGVEFVSGGAGGLNGGGFCVPRGYAPAGSAAIVSGGTVVYSNVLGGLGASTGTFEIVPADPCLAASGSGVAGTAMTFTLHGEPGDTARLSLGRQMVVEDVPFVHEDRLVTPLRTYLLGTVPPSGSLTFAFHVPTSLPAGFVVIAQARTTSAAGETRLTQSAPFAVR